jgi:hypothetical protein
MTAGAFSVRWAGRVASVVFLAIEPFVLIALLLGAVALTFSLSAHEPNAGAVNAVAVPLELAVACWLLSARLERRAQAEEYALVELLLGFGGDLVHAFPRRAHTARERVDAGTPLLQLTAQDLLRMARETPCRATGVAAAWVALVLAVTPVAQWMWHAMLYEGAASVVTGALIAACLLPFAVVWRDLRQGRVRSLRDPRRARLWGEGYHPARPPLVLPSVPVMLILFLPAGLLGANWSAGASLAGRINVTEAVFGFWLLAWNGRAIVASAVFRRMERRAAAADDLIRRCVTPAWDLATRACRWSGWSSAALFALALSWPRALHSGAPGTLTDVSALLLTTSLTLGLLIVLHWQRPVAPRTRSGEELLAELSEAQVRRISVGLNVGLATTMLLIAVLGGLA